MEFNSKIEDLFRNICESVSPAVDPTSPTYDPEATMFSSEAEVEQTTISPKKKIKQKPVPSYLKQTAAAKARQRDKSPNATTGNKRALSPTNMMSPMNTQ